MEMAGQFVSGQLTKPNYEDQEKLQKEFYENAKAIARTDETKREKELRRIAYKPAEPEIDEGKDLTEEKIEEGIACLPCSSDHFSTVSGALSEALRFARTGGVRHPEVMRRLGLAKDELNVMERIDLSPENLVQLEGKEKKLAEWGLNASRELRHKITAIRSPEDLENVAADVAEIRTKFMRELWDVATVDGTIDKLCKGLKDEEKERCMSTIANILDEKT